MRKKREAKFVENFLRKKVKLKKNWNYYLLKLILNAFLSHEIHTWQVVANTATVTTDSRVVRGLRKSPTEKNME